jgi:predicted nucleic acid-binding protein
VQFDTDVLIWYLRGNLAAAKLIDRTSDREISVVSYMELMQSSRGKSQIRHIWDFLTQCAFAVVSLSENIGHRASIYMEEYGPAAGLNAMDALIAATAVESDSDLVTGNVKHFLAITELRVVQFEF